MTVPIKDAVAAIREFADRLEKSQLQDLDEDLRISVDIHVHGIETRPVLTRSIVALMERSIPGEHVAHPDTKWVQSANKNGVHVTVYYDPTALVGLYGDEEESQTIESLLDEIDEIVGSTESS